MTAGQSIGPEGPFSMRNVHFAVAECDMRAWHPAGTHVSHFYNALSVRFPEGEKFFINSVRHYRDDIRDPALQRDIEAFIGQEAMHRREHRKYNEALQASGYDAAGMETRLQRQIQRLKAPPLFQLCVTCACEHFTAIMSHAMLSDDRSFEGADPEMASLWRWHALEETEHKAVAYDVYQAVCTNAFAGYLLRSVVMLLTTMSFWFHALTNMVHMVRRDKAMTDWGGWLALWRYLLGRPGIARRMLIPYLAYFKPGFHPWSDGSSLDEFDRWKQAADLRLQEQQASPTVSQAAA
jgi:predicted metal-dependent hydrolase